MKVTELLREEIRIEKKILKEIRRKRNLYPVKRLFMSRSKRGHCHFYYREPSGRKTIYIKSEDSKLIRGISYGRYLKEYEKILEKNIALIDKILPALKNYDHESVLANLPVTYRRAIEFISEKEPAPVIQSENPKHPEQLVYKASNGLMLRSKNEMLICEMLLLFRVKFRYEMALELRETVREKDGSVTVRSVRVYPDFTIFLPDGSVIYWEHFGLNDRDDYRGAFADKINLYYDNAIYPPKNLIITMDGDSKPFDNLKIRKIIEAQILPLC